MATTLMPGSMFFLFTKSQRATDTSDGFPDEDANDSNTPSLMPSKAHSPPIDVPSEHHNHHHHHADSSLRPSVYRKILKHRKRRAQLSDPQPSPSDTPILSDPSDPPFPRKHTVFTDLTVPRVKKKAMFNAPPTTLALSPTPSMVERTLEELSTAHSPSAASLTPLAPLHRRCTSESKTDDGWLDEAVNELLTPTPSPRANLNLSSSPRANPHGHSKPRFKVELYDQIKRVQSKQNELDTHCLVVDALAHSLSDGMDCSEQLVMSALAEVDELDHRPWPQPLQWQQRSDSLLDSEHWWVSEVYNRSDSRRSSASCSFDVELLYD